MGERSERILSSADACFLAAFAVASLSLCGWIFGDPRLNGFGIASYPDWPWAAIANQLIAFGLIGIRRVSLPVLLAALAFPVAIALITLTEYLSGWSIGLDASLFTAPVLRVPLAYPGRPGLIPAVSILTVAIATAFAALNRRRMDEIVFPLACALVSLAALSLAVLLLEPGLVRQSHRLAASLPATLASLAEATGLLLLLRDRRVSLFQLAGDNRRAWAWLLPIILVTPAILLPIQLKAVQSGLVVQLTAEILASVINLLVVVWLLSWLLARLAREQEALREIEKRQSVAVEAHGLGIFDWDVASGRLSWSPGAEQRLGLRPGTIVDYDSWRAQVEPDDVTAIEETIADVIARKAEHFTFRYRFIEPNGAVRAIEGSAHCYYDDAGNLVRTVGVNMDVTDRDQREAALLAGEAQLRSILETVPDAMVIIDERGIVRSFSAAAERIFGYAAEDVIGRNVRMLMPEMRSAQHDSYLARYIETGVRHVIGQTRRLAARRSDGSEMPIELSVGEAWIGGERIFTGFVRDISDRVEAEERLEALRAEHAHSARLSAMGEMAAALAHELNQPLAAGANFFGTAELLLEGMDGAADAAAMVKLGSSQIMRAGDIIRRLRDFIAKGESELRVEPLEPIVREATALGLVGSRQLGVEVSYDLAPEASHVIVDRIQIQQVLVNMLRNAAEALRAMPEGARTIRVEARVENEEMVRLSVIDSGAGLPAEVLDNLYAPFLSTKGEGGLGIGLSICRRIVEAHGGVLTAANEPTGGAHLSFTLPRYQETAETGQ